MENIINGSTPEGLREYAEAIKIFCVEIHNEMSVFFQNHLKMNKYWQGEQYDQFTEQFRILCQKTEKEVQQLMALRKIILNKADELEKSLSIELDIQK